MKFKQPRVTDVENYIRPEKISIYELAKSLFRIFWFFATNKELRNTDFFITTFKVFVNEITQFNYKIKHSSIILKNGSQGIPLIFKQDIVDIATKTAPSTTLLPQDIGKPLFFDYLEDEQKKAMYNALKEDKEKEQQNG